MASVFGHVMASTAIGFAFFPKQSTFKILAVAGFCAFAPDLDILAFNFGIAYENIWGHRGASHSIFFALVFGLAMAAVFYRNRADFWKIALLFILATVSHPLLDACTTGGRGVALFFPIDNSRIFFPFRKILVSPISPGDFFSDWGLQVLGSELIWIALPGLFLVLICNFFRKIQAN